MSFIPSPCPTGSTPGGGGGDFQFGRDVEGQLLCDIVNGDVVGSAMAIYQYDEETGNRIGNPTFIDPVTGNPYVVQGTLQPCGSTDNIDVEEITVCAWYNVNFRGPAIKRTVFIDGVAQPPVFLGDDGNVFTPSPPVNTAAWFPGDCFWDSELAILCDDDGPFIRYYTTRGSGDLWSLADYELDGQDRPNLPVGTVRICSETSSGTTADRDREVVCWTTTAGGNTIFTGTIRHDDALPAPGWLLFNQHQTPVNPAEPGLTFVPCGRFLEIEPVCMMVLGERTPGFRREDETGVVTFLGVNGTVVVPGSWTAGPCISDVEHQSFCDQGNNNTTFIRTTRYGVFGEQIGTPDDYTIDGAVYIPVGPISAGSCVDNTHIQVEQACLDTTPGVNYFAEFPANRGAWERSNDGGTTWTPNPPSSTNQVAGPTGQQRFRQVFTIPPGPGGNYTVTVSGDIVAHGVGGPAQVYYDGVFQSDVDTPSVDGPEDFVFPATPGVHTFELWIGDNNDPGGLTSPVVTVEYNVRRVGSSIEIVKVLNSVGDILDVRYFDVTGNEISPTPTAAQLTLGLCSQDDNNPAETTQTIRAQHRLLNAGDTWTPAEVGGTLTGFTYTIITGTATVVDQNGTNAVLPAGVSASWQVEEDQNTLAGLQSVQAAGGQTYVSWTER